MKRLFVIGLSTFLVALAVIYVFIPQELKISSIAVFKANERSVHRSLNDRNNWEKWWPNENADIRQNEKDELSLNGFTYETGTKLPEGIEVIIRHGSSLNTSLMQLLRLSQDSMMLQWTATVSTSYNPITRVEKFVEAKKIKQGMEQITAKLKSYAETQTNMYGIDIQQTRVTDTILMAMKNVQKERPTTKQIYFYIESLSKYIAAAGAAETNRPMLHFIYQPDIKNYEVMVAIPVSRKLTGTHSILRKRMVPGNILYADVVGGEATVEEAMRQMEYYVEDHEKLSPAIPYQLLVTDRTKETDTTKWVTRIYYPVL